MRIAELMGILQRTLTILQVALLIAGTSGCGAFLGADGSATQPPRGDGSPVPSSGTIAPRGGSVDATTRPNPTPAPSVTPQTSIVISRFGSSDVSAYHDTYLDRLSELPSVEGPFSARLSGHSTVGVGFRTPTELASITRLIVRGTVTGFSDPYWNSSDGGFWSPRYISSITSVPNNLYRDVRFDVAEVLGNVTGQTIATGELTFTVHGGQAVVTIPPDVAALDEHYLPAGKYLWVNESYVDLSIGEEAVIFLDYQGIYGLYRGDEYGYVIRLVPAHLSCYKYSLSTGGKATNDGLLPHESSAPFVTTVEELRSLAESGPLGTAILRPQTPDDAVHTLPPSHSHEPGGETAP